jgi:hypothetical protein
MFGELSMGNGCIKPGSEFIGFVREGDWTAATAEISAGRAGSWVETPNDSVFLWLIDINAPTALIVALLEYSKNHEGLEFNRLGLLEECIERSTTRSNAFETFSALLAWGLSPKVYAIGGCTLLQKAIALDRTREVAVLLRYGADPLQRSIFGDESTSAIDVAKESRNAAADIVLASVQDGGADA